MSLEEPFVKFRSILIRIRLLIYGLSIVAIIPLAAKCIVASKRLEAPRCLQVDQSPIRPEFSSCIRSMHRACLELARAGCDSHGGLRLADHKPRRQYVSQPNVVLGISLRISGKRRQSLGHSRQDFCSRSMFMPEQPGSKTAIHASLRCCDHPNRRIPWLLVS